MILLIYIAFEHGKFLMINKSLWKFHCQYKTVTITLRASRVNLIYSFIIYTKAISWLKAGMTRHKTFFKKLFFTSFRWSTIKAKSRRTISLFSVRLQHKNYFFYPLWDGIVMTNYCLKIYNIPLPTHCLNVALNSGVCAIKVWINFENKEWRKSLINTLEWFDTFGPDFSYTNLRSRITRIFTNTRSSYQETQSLDDEVSVAE